MKELKVDDIQISNNLPFILIGGLNVLENYELTYDSALYIKKVCENFLFHLFSKHHMTKLIDPLFIRTEVLGSIKVYQFLKKLKEELNIKIITDVHSVEEVYKIKDYVDIIQLPAFFSKAN